MSAAASVGSISAGRSPATSRATCPARSLSSSTTRRHASGPGTGGLGGVRAGAAPTRATVASITPAVITRRADPTGSGVAASPGRPPRDPPRGRPPATVATTIAGDGPPSALERGALGTTIERRAPRLARGHHVPSSSTWPRSSSSTGTPSSPASTSASDLLPRPPRPRNRPRVRRRGAARPAGSRPRRAIRDGVARH